jgi:FeS assembly SUF system regulator
MLRMSKLTDYGTMVLAELATNRRGLSTASQVADATHLTLPTVSKLLKSLAHSGLVVSARGVQGGYALARPAGDISAAEILDALEGPVALTDCSSSAGSCELESFCRVGTAWQRINHSIRRALEGVSLADLQDHRELLPSLRGDLRKTAAAAR